MAGYRKVFQACMPLILFMPIVSILSVCFQSLAEIFPFFLLFARLSALYSKALPLLLAAFVSYQFSKCKDGSVVISAMIAYLLMISVLQSEVLNEAVDYQWHADVAIDYMQNPLTGVLCGLAAAKLFERFSQVQLPRSLAFFSGRRFVPILTIFCMLAFAVPTYFIWTFCIRSLFSVTSYLYTFEIAGASISKVLNTGLLAIGLRDISDRFYILPGFQKGIPIMQFGVVPFVMLAWMLLTLKEKQYRRLFFIFLCLLQTLLSGNSDAFELFMLFAAPLLWVLHLLSTGCVFYLAYYDVSAIFLSLLFGGCYVCVLWLLYCKHKIYLPQDDLLVFSEEYLHDVLEIFGGMENMRDIKAVDRVLEICVYDTDFVEEDALQRLCVYHLQKDDKRYELIIGNQAHELKQALQKVQEEELQQLLL